MIDNISDNDKIHGSVVFIFFLIFCFHRKFYFFFYLVINYTHYRKKENEPWNCLKTLTNHFSLIVDTWNDALIKLNWISYAAVFTIKRVQI